jgi:hypothetical protein
MARAFRAVVGLSEGGHVIGARAPQPARDEGVAIVTRAALGLRRLRNPLLLVSGLLLACGVACSGMLAEPAPQVETAALHDSAGDAVIATLHTKDSELTITSSGGHVRYSLLDEQGLSKSLTLDELQRHDPNLYEFVKAAMARSSWGGQKGGPVLDARVERTEPTPPASSERVEADRHRVAPPLR